MVKPGRTYTGVLFDLDNTLVDRDAALRRIANSLFGSQPSIGERVSRRSAVTRIIELDEDGHAGRDLLMERVLHEWPAIETSHAELLDWCSANYGPSFVKDKRVTGFLEELSRIEKPWGIVTNGSTRQRETLHAVGLDALCPCIVVSGELGHRKPEPKIFHEALRCLGLEAGAEVLFVGDDPVADIGGARSAGLSTAWVHRGRTWPDGLPPPDHVVAHVADLAPQLALRHTRMAPSAPGYAKSAAMASTMTLRSCSLNSATAVSTFFRMLPSSGSS